jgi:septal ring factor EnvC (AmiA/AmiB activator)
VRIKPQGKRWIRRDRRTQCCSGLLARIGAVLVLAGLVMLHGPEQLPFMPEARAESRSEPGASESSSTDDDEAATADPAEVDTHSRELERVRRELEEAAAAERALAEEIASLEDDRAALAKALIEATTRIRENENRSEELTMRLESLIASEAAIRRSLEARRGVIVEVLAALQRMGRRPPPAVLARPDDILAAVRTSMLLGAVVPALRAETRALAADLEELVALRSAIALDREALARELATLDSERRRLSALIETRQERLHAAREDAVGEGARIASLAAQADTLEELITTMEREIAAAREAAEAARASDQRLRDETEARFAAAAALDPARLAPQIPFAQARGRLPRPVGGTVFRGFSEPDDLGGAMKGVAISTRSGEIVTAPADGWIAYAGPYRSFERLLIINAGDDYHIMISGMERITVDVGQFVLAGEPVAMMGSTALVSPAMGIVDAEGPVLYVEFLKDGGSIDPSPWWQETIRESRRGAHEDTESEKVRG